MFTLNDTPIKPITPYASPEEDDYPKIQFKNYHPERALELLESGYVKALLRAMLKVTNKFRYQYVDVKVHHLKPGDRTTPHNLWHLDSSLNPIVDYENCLFVSGEGALTEFVTTPIQIPEAKHRKEFDTLVKRCKIETCRIPSSTITRYNGRNVHRGVKATKHERRLLVRVVNTDRTRLPAYIIGEKQ